jgi:DNA uptake protein ComE-like DNA-binding protein
MRKLLRAVALGLAVLCAGAAIAPQPAPKSAQKQAVLVDINHATLDELLTVPGMTKSWAGRIIRFRPYRSKQDLLDHGVVPSEVYDRIREFIVAHHQPQ